MIPWPQFEGPAVSFFMTGSSRTADLLGMGSHVFLAGFEKRIGVDYFRNVTYVSVPSSHSVRELVAIGHLDRLETLMLGGSSVSDEGLRHLKELTNLQSLDLSGTDVTGTGLKHLTGLSRLKSLSLRRTQVTDAGMVHLRR